MEACAHTRTNKLVDEPIDRLPGHGKVDWHKLFQVLREAGSGGNMIIEHEDPVFGGRRMKEGLLIAERFLEQFVW
ncbi:MAG: hypothetical protein ACPL7K_01420, partial [Armatimonadota bacterium]